MACVEMCPFISPQTCSLKVSIQAWKEIAAHWSLHWNKFGANETIGQCNILENEHDRWIPVMLYLTLLEMSSCCRQGMCMKIVCLVHHQYSKTRTHSSMPLVLSVFFFFGQFLFTLPPRCYFLWEWVQIREELKSSLKNMQMLNHLHLNLFIL